METIVNGIKKLVRTLAMAALFVAWSGMLLMGGYYKGQNSVYELTAGNASSDMGALVSLVTPATKELGIKPAEAATVPMPVATVNRSVAHVLTNPGVTKK